MNRNNIILLKNLLLSTSRWNSYKYCKDKKKRGKIVGSAVGSGILYLMLMAYCVLNCIGYGYYGLTGAIPVMCAVIISILSAVFTVFKTNGYLFNFKEYDMLMSLPFEAKDVAACKFLYMYIKSLPWYMSVSVSMMIVYGVYARPGIAVYPVWLLLSLLLPVIPMLAAAFIGFIIAKLGSGFRNKTIAQTVLSMLLIIACFASRFFLESMFRENKTEKVLNSVSDLTDSAGRIYLPIKWFGGAVTELRISDILLLIGATLILFELIFIPVGRSYRKINSALKSHAASGGFVMKEQKGRSVIGAIAFKEFKRMTGSTVYMTNILVGEIMCLIAGVAILFVDIDKLLISMFKDMPNANGGAPITKEMLYPAIPFIVYFFIGMVSTTAVSPSLEGKNYWIIQSLPIRKKTLYLGKILFNLCLILPFALFTVTTFCISMKAPLVNSLLHLLLIICLCVFSSTWGCVCGVKHMRLDWENEVEVVKQGTAVAVYMFPNMIATMGLIVLSVFLGTKFDQNLVSVIMILAVSVLSFLSYRRVLSLSKE